MAEDRSDPTAPADQPSSTPGNPHFFSRHNRRPELYLRTTARQLIMDFVEPAQRHVNSRILKKKKKARETLKDSVERLKLALKTFEDLGEDRQHELLAIMWPCFHIGRIYPALAGDSKKRTEAGRKRNAEVDNEARALGLKLFDEEREKTRWRDLPMRRRDILKIAEVVAPLVVAKMKERGHPNYRLAPATVVGWVRDREKARSKIDT